MQGRLDVRSPDPTMTSSTAGPAHGGSGLFGMLLAVSVVLVAAVLVVTGRQPRTLSAQTFGDAVIALAAVVATLACVLAARRGGPERRGWTLLAVAAGVWTVGMLIYAGYGLTRDHVYPFPSVADIGFLGFGLPAVAGLLAFPRERNALVSRLRAALDGLVIAASIVFVSWSVVLGPVFHAGGTTLLARVTGLAYPIVDVVLASLVLVLGLRRPAGARLPWLLLGTGLLVLVVTDSTYVTLVLNGQVALTGTVLAAGWAAAFLLVALAALAPVRPVTGHIRRHFTMTQELLPYVPFAAVVVEVTRQDITDEPFLLLIGAVVVLLVGFRQVVMVYEKVALAGDLESQVVVRTAELSVERHLLEAVLENLDTGVIACDAGGDLTLFNRAARELYGTVDSLESATQIVMCDTDGDLDEAVPMLPERTPLVRALHGEDVRNAELVIDSQDGERRAVVANARPIADVRGASLGAVVAIHDITDRKRDEIDLGIARNEALESSRMKSQFLATMSHEIRTPMNGLIGLSGLLLGTILDATQRQYAEGVSGAGEALLSVINDVLDFSKLEAGKVELEAIDFDPRRLVDEVGALFAEAAQHKRLELVAYCLTDVPARLRGDAGRLRQVLVNLMSNAVKFTAAGEVVLRARLADDDLAGVVLRFEVIDSGMGIDPAGRERLFEPFSQADASTTRRYGGTGLGLAICRRLAETMGGQIGVTGEAGQGSTFWFAVPLGRAQTEAAPAPAERHRVTPGQRVLVVDDNETNRLVLSGQLAGWRMRPDVAADAPEALRLLRQAVEAGDPYPVAVLDMCLPDVDGLALARAIHDDPALPDMKLILLTSVMSVDPQAAREAGIGALITKPARQSVLYDRLAELTDPRSAGASAATPPAAPASSAAGTAAVAQRGRILVVEDNTVNQLVAEALVTKLGYQVDIVANGLLALRAVAHCVYDAVLMDCHMPEMDGFAATAEIRRSEGEIRRTPIIAMTAGARAEDREQCVAAGMDDYLSKPVDATALEILLARWVPTPAPLTAPAIDASRLETLRRLGPAGDDGLLDSVVRSFLGQGPGGLARLQAAADSADARALSEAAHHLLGAAANIGATAVAALCEELEMIGRSGDVTGAGELIRRLGAELERATGPLVGVLSATR